MSTVDLIALTRWILDPSVTDDPVGWCGARSAQQLAEVALHEHLLAPLARTAERHAPYLLEAAPTIGESARVSTIRDEQYRAEVGAAADLLADIGAVVVKGFSLHAYYERPDLTRPFSDVDVLVPDIAEAWRLVRRLRRAHGYRIEHTMGLVRRGDGWHCEAELGRVHDGAHLEWEVVTHGFPISFLTFCDVRRRTGRVPIGDGRLVPVSSCEDGLMVLAAECFSRRRVVTRDLMDWCMITAASRPDWRYLSTRSRETGLGWMVDRLAEQGTILAHSLNGASRHSRISLPRIGLLRRMRQVAMASRSARVLGRDLRNRVEMRMFDSTTAWRLLRLINERRSPARKLLEGDLAYLIPTGPESNTDVDMGIAWQCLRDEAVLWDSRAELLIVENGHAAAGVTPVGVFGVGVDGVVRDSMLEITRRIAGRLKEAMEPDDE
jgi:hypothetical protein